MRQLYVPFALVLLLACGGDAEVETAESTSGGTHVTDPAGVTHTVTNPGAIDELAAAFTEHGHRVDVGDFFERDEIAGIPGRRLNLRGAILDTWTFDSPAAARTFAGRFSNDGRLFDGEELPWHDTTHVWVRGPMVIMYIGNDGTTVAAVEQVARDQTDHAEDELITGEQMENIVRSAAGDRLAVAPAALQLVSRERVTFRDACLEVPEAAEVCHEVETPGWRFIFMNGEERIVAHADLGGARVFFPGHGG